MARRRARREPTREQVTVAIAKAEHYTATCRKTDTTYGRIVDEILDPLLAQYHALASAARDLLRAAAESTEGTDTPAMARVRAALERGTPILD